METNLIVHLSLSQTPSGWRLIENWAMLLLDVGFVHDLCKLIWRMFTERFFPVASYA